MLRTVDPAIPAGTMSSVPQPTIAVDDQLIARPFHFGDVDRVIEAFADPDIRHWHARRIDTVTEARVWIGYGHMMWLREQTANFAIVDADDRLLGRVGLHTDLPGGTFEIAYWVLPDARRCRVAMRTGRALTRWGHDQVGLSRIVRGGPINRIRTRSNLALRTAPRRWAPRRPHPRPPPSTPISTQASTLPRRRPAASTPNSVTPDRYRCQYRLPRFRPLEIGECNPQPTHRGRLPGRLDGERRDDDSRRTR